MTKPSILRNPQLDGSSFYWGAGPRGVLLCHGFTATTTEVHLLAQALFAVGYSVSAPLLPGHGTTPEDCNHVTWKDWYTCLEQAYQELARQCTTVVVGGESMGALLALHLAAAHPELAAVLCYAPALRLNLGRLQVILLALMAPIITSVPKPPPADDNPWQGYGEEPLKATRQLLALQKVVLPELPAIRQPILILQGRLDPTVHPSAPQVIYDQVSSPVKQLQWLDNSTHCVILDKERQLAASLTLDFLNHALVNTSPIP